MKGEDQQMDYRRSCYTDSDLLITGGLFQLQKGDRREILRKMQDLRVRRESKQPLDFPSAGSTFKRPARGFAAELIDRCGLKGLTVGGAQVSTKHAGFIINKGDATCADVLELVQRVQKAVRIGSGVELEMEVRRLP